MPTTTKKFTARKKVAAAALALTAGVVGAGFAAGTITLENQVNNVFGQGKSEFTPGVQDVTGVLTVIGPTGTISPVMGGGYSYKAGDTVTITGWENLANAQGATYTIQTSVENSDGWEVQKTGEVTADMTQVELPAKQGTGTSAKNVDGIVVTVHK